MVSSQRPRRNVDRFLALRTGSRREYATVVVQCPSCQSKFRIADEKVTDRGVRVRCTACKNVFQVKRSGAAAETKKTEQQGVTGTTQEMQALDPALLKAKVPARPALARPQPATPAPALPGQTAIFAIPIAPPTSPGPSTQARPAARATPKAPPAASSTAVRRPAPAPAPASAGGRPRLHADDLFGMSELTGDTSSPPGSALSSNPGFPVARPAARPAPKPAARSAPRPASKTAPSPKPARSADDFEAALDAAVGNRDVPAARPPPPPDDFGDLSDAAPPPGPAEDAPSPPEPPAGPEFAGLADPFEGVDLATSGDHAGVPVDLSDPRKPGEPAPATDAPASAPPPPADSLPPRSGYREAVGSALTGLVGAALALAFVLGSALSEATGTGWLGLGSGSDVVATHVMSGLYETAGGRLVFFVRGRVINNGKKPRGPVRVIAELVTDQGAEARMETLAGMEPTPEEVYALKSPSDTDRLSRTLSRNDGERRIPPGGSLPFFAVLSEPPTDLHRHRLQVHLETLDAWAGIQASPKPAAAPAAPKADAPKADAPRAVPK